ncbi:xanthine dehydrogenase family protein molybdopterin-binding subunit [Solirubrobacter sp. CPCC 204708]|uniref:Xanthine dehydrogenase family protein molybdopterin-binding subunit n=1 Tax=Solirubrobacter deserti TaxID=2282478 RepID=A0ABT4RBR6_9ACTN|nr:xanthine dehydrogenase family protein molybdopterin-binding subunit [Solirubrobacter deserti]MBE2317133.1 xanthine dehydrogenase family protein molybdopterin-binding subunit [Solirubrobacter deserti]MDA0135974.1 xanthine dehydrogenase family protein molybdopterin-binding subunit [Solirubrobacter deserti]
MGVASTLRREDARLLAGRGQFLDDVPLPGALHMAFVRSPHAHARLNLKGSGAFIFTAADVAGHVAPAQIVPPPGLTVEPVPHPVLADGVVRYVGQPVAAVVAESRAAAEDLAESVEVEYEPLPAVVDPRAGDTMARWEKREGDVAGAFARAAHVVRTERVIPRLAAVPMEPRGALAVEEDGRLTVWSSSQSAHRPRAQLAQSLGRDEASIRVIVPDVGGAFGSKGTLPVETPLVAFAASRLGRPVRWTEDRYENFLSAPQGRGVRGWVELGFDDEGRILALRGRVLADLGAYLLPSTPMPPHTTAMLLAGGYDIPAVEVIVTGARTHKVPTAPYRGAGRPEASYLIETALDEAARRLGLDPLALRRRNLVRSFPHRTALGWTYDSGAFEACLDRAVDLIGDVEPQEPGVLVGVGFALAVERSGGLHEHASVTREGDEVVVRAGSVPSGQGHETLFAQLAAERLGVDPAMVRVITGDSDALAQGVGSFASRTATMGGNAVVAAADDLLAGGPGVARFESDQVFTSGAYAAVVEVVRATGEVRLRRLVAVDDAGRILHPRLAEGQVIGGAVQGLGAMLSEEVVHDASGQPVSASLLDYALPTAAEIPEFATAFVESPSPLNPLGVKGIGESGTIGAPPAIANALAAAIGRHLDPPYTAQRVWEALR